MTTKIVDIQKSRGKRLPLLQKSHKGFRVVTDGLEKLGVGLCELVQKHRDDLGVLLGHFSELGELWGALKARIIIYK